MASLWPSVSWGLSVFVGLLLIQRVLLGTWNPLHLVVGTDGLLSVSKLQWMLWTGTVLFAYVAIYVAQVRTDVFTSLGDVPVNVLRAMGFSTATAAVAKGIAAATKRLPAIDIVGHVAVRQGRPWSLADLVTDDDDRADISKVQLLAWTILAIVIFILQTFDTLGKVATAAPGQLRLPDIDASLMVLMGLGQAGYIGKKIASIKDVPKAVAAPATIEVGTITASHVHAVKVTATEISTEVISIPPEGIVPRS